MQELEKITALATAIAARMLQDDGPPLTAREFAIRNGTSRSVLYEMWKRGEGPATVRVGVRGRRITRKAEREWRAKRETESSASQAPGSPDVSTPAATEVPHQT
jgi:hypothetical protein